MRKYIDGVYCNLNSSETETVQQIHINEEIRQIKKELEQSDYLAIKFAEGQLTDSEYAAVKAERQRRRERIRQLRKMRGDA